MLNKIKKTIFIEKVMHIIVDQKIRQQAQKAIYENIMEKLNNWDIPVFTVNNTLSEDNREFSGRFVYSDNDEITKLSKTIKKACSTKEELYNHRELILPRIEISIPNEKDKQKEIWEFDTTSVLSHEARHALEYINKEKLSLEDSEWEADQYIKSIVKELPTLKLKLAAMITVISRTEDYSIETIDEYIRFLGLEWKNISHKYLI